MDLVLTLSCLSRDVTNLFGMEQNVDSETYEKSDHAWEGTLNLVNSGMEGFNQVSCTILYATPLSAID